MEERWNSANEFERKLILSRIGIGGLGWLAYRSKQWNDLPKKVRARLGAVEDTRAAVKG